MTKARLLKVAERLFAEKGFAAVSVREITAAAGVHLSAVNYHFDSKEKLYLEVFRSRWLPKARRLSALLDKLAERESLTGRELTETLTKAMLADPPLKPEEVLRHHRLMVWEMVHPGQASDLLAREFLKPVLEKLKNLLARVLPTETGEERLTFLSLSIMSLIRYYNQGRPMITMVLGPKRAPEFMAGVADQLSEFILHGLQAPGEES